MGLFNKNKKHNVNSSTSSTSPQLKGSVPNSPGSPGYYGHQDLVTSEGAASHVSSTKPILPDVKRASGYFDLNLQSDSPLADILNNPPPPAVLPTHNTTSESTYAAQAAMKSQSKPTHAASFYETIPKISSRVVSSSSETNHPALLLKPPMLSAHNRAPSEDQSTAFDGFDGVFIQPSPDAQDPPVTLPTLNPLSEHYGEQHDNSMQSGTETLAQNKISNNANKVNNNQNTPSLNATTMESSSPPKPASAEMITVTTSNMSASYDPDLNSPASSNYSMSNTIQDSPVESTSTPFSLQSSAPNQIEPRKGPSQNRNVLAPIPVPHVTEPVRPALTSPSAAAAAMASASLKSQLKIGTVRVVESQQASVELAGSTFYAGEEGFSSLDHSAESSQLNSDDEDTHHVQTYTANQTNIVHSTAGQITRVYSGSDSSFVNVTTPNTDSESLSSGVVVPRSTSNVATPTDSSHPSIQNPYLVGTSEKDRNETHSSSIPAQPSAPFSLDPNQSSHQSDHQRYKSEASQFSMASTYLSDFEEPERIMLYHPQPYRIDSNIPSSSTSDNINIRASMISTASSNILESSGGIPNIDTLSLAEKAAGPSGQESDSIHRAQALGATESQLTDGQPDMRHSMPLIQRPPSGGRTLSSLMPKSDFRNSHMSPMQDQDGIYYPAPIPVELRLPPLLSKKNQKKAKGGRPLSRRPGSFMRLGSMVFPTPPVWQVENGVTPSDRRSMMSRRLSSASTLNAFNQRKSGEFDDGRSSVFDRNSTLDPELQPAAEGSENASLATGEEQERASIMTGDEEVLEERPTPQIVDVKGKGVSAPLRDEEDHDLRDAVLSVMTSEGKIGELRDESWGESQSVLSRPYTRSMAGDFYDGEHTIEYSDEDDGFNSDCATLQSDEEYQDDLLVDEEETKKLTAEAEAADGIIRNGNIDDFAFTSFNPNSAVTDRGLLAGSIAYSSGMVPAVGVQPPSLIEELEMRKAGKKARLQRTYYDSNTGNAIATETVGRTEPAPEQLLREPHSGHPLDARHSKSLLELQYIADQDYEDQKVFRHTIHAAVESDRMSRMGFSSSTNLINAMAAQSTAIDDGDPNESLGARRARLKKKRKEEAEAGAAAAAEDQYQNETLAERRARLKKEKQLLKQQKEQLTLVDVGAADGQAFTTQPSVIAT